MAPGPETQNKIVHVGLVGTGSVAQVIHLPTLALMSHLFKVTAVCDISAQSREHSAKKWGIPKAYASSKELVQDPNVDLVFVLNNDEYHAPVALEAITAGKHVLIEKPMALTFEDADAIAAAAAKAGVVVFIGYMRRYAPALKQAIELLGGHEKIEYAKIRDIIGPNALFIPQSGTFPLAFSDYPPTALTERTEIEEEIYARALGNRAHDETVRALWRLLGGLGSHDLSVMREVLGMPRKALAAHTRIPRSRFISAMFDYGSFVCVYETGVDQVGKFDACIEIFAGDKRVKVDYDSPFIKGLPISIILSSNINGQFVEQKIIPTYEDPYTLEMKELYDAIVARKKFKSTVEDARKDIEIFNMVVDALPATS
ncbi:NAD-P-binding protein [Calocera viscosa TUFC12733]|uniref:NAD-P-binding protein n=1 Tax=Calocera viscosa (strain TUFC12733) TaxID=1330018 RepID=A0A167JHD5_CALVF|nr:NAD-P-binding protein [Calocera viscosa TUFC12733]